MPKAALSGPMFSVPQLGLQISYRLADSSCNRTVTYAVSRQRAPIHILFQLARGDFGHRSERGGGFPLLHSASKIVKRASIFSFQKYLIWMRITLLRVRPCFQYQTYPWLMRGFRFKKIWSVSLAKEIFKSNDRSDCFSLDVTFQRPWNSMKRKKVHLVAW